MTNKKQTLKEANYQFMGMSDDNYYYRLLNLDTKCTELFVKNKNHASWGIKYKNTHLEFCASE